VVVSTLFNRGHYEGAVLKELSSLASEYVKLVVTRYVRHIIMSKQEKRNHNKGLNLFATLPQCYPKPKRLTAIKL
jgi:hypothetical protein